ncbi:MAG: protease inhibitor I42 family protein [Dehalococcoidia bacterium]|nr:protease inhibitor I42 family protein [Dehalococcoidia bacterium]
MKKAIGIALALVVLAGTLGFAAACSGVDASSPSMADIQVDASYSGQEVKLVPGKELSVTLVANPSTGYSWELAGNSDESVEFVDTKHQPAQSGLIGAEGEDTWTFKALKKGESKIVLEYERPWEQGVEPLQIFELTIVVE